MATDGGRDLYRCGLTANSTDAGEMIAALPFSREHAQNALELITLEGIFGKRESFLAGQFEQFTVAQRVGNMKAEIAGLANPEISFLGRIFEKSIMRFNDDMIVMPLQAATQWDALSHVYYEDRMYNGFPASAVTSFGATKLAITAAVAKGIT